MKNSIVLVGAVMAFFLFGCGSENPRKQLSAYKITVGSGLVELPWPSQIESLFGEADHFIVHYGFLGGGLKDEEWQSVVYFGGRYELALSVQVKVDYGKNQVVKSVSPPLFYLKEIQSIDAITSDGGVDASVANVWVINEEKWKKLFDAKGDWLAIDISVDLKNPMPEFENYVQSCRRDRIKVK